MDIAKAYQNALKIYHAGCQKSVLNESIETRWCKGSEDFWFTEDIENDDHSIGIRYRRYCCASDEIVDLFSGDMKMTVLDVDDSRGVIYARTPELGEVIYDMDTGHIKPLKVSLFSRGANTAPDKEHSLLFQNHNLLLRNNCTGMSRQITEDGTKQSAYGRLNPTDYGKQLTGKPSVVTPSASWSPNSRYFLTYCSDTKKMRSLPFVQSDPHDDRHFPKASAVPYPIPGDEAEYTGILYAGDTKGPGLCQVTMEGKPFRLGFSSMFLLRPKWSEDGNSACIMQADSLGKVFSCIIVDLKAATARRIFSEEYDTFGFADQYDEATYHGCSAFSLFYSSITQEVIWRSEKEGRSAFYLYDAASGQLKRRLTDLSMSARTIKHVDVESRSFYYTASGEKMGVDPYYQFLYRTDMDTLETVCLSKEIAEHFVSFAPCGKYYLDTFSTVQTPPEAVIKRCDCDKSLDVAKADIKRILDAGFIFPEPFEALARDGKTKIHGILIKPRDFDPAKRYPVIDYIYGGSSHINVPKAFAFADRNITDPLCGLESQAQLGFVGVIIDGLATPLRTKEIHDYVYGAMGECCGLSDHVTAIRQLADRYPWIDADRVGIWGFSGGGYASARALLQFPDFYKVGVSVCGCHDPAIQRSDYSQRWMGPYDSQKYAAQSNAVLASQLSGKLLLIQGDMDVNVHMAHTLRLVSALIQENKDFDLLLYPNGGHILAFKPYVIRRRWDYFVQHLLGETPPKETNMNLEMEE